MEIRLTFGWILALIGIATGAALGLFGAWYNRQVARWAAEGHIDDGFTAIEVAAGSLVTLLLTGPFLVLAIGWQHAVVALGTVMAAFAASGLPMILGSIGRHLQARRNGRDIK